jgi:RNase adaptor protein for sRNA GlmZ degradation
MLILDAVRTGEQLNDVRRHFSTLHVHLTAAREALRARYEQKRGEGSLQELNSYTEVAADETEAATDALAEPADLILDTTNSGPRENAKRVIERLRDDQRLLDRPRSSNRTRR